MEAAQCKQVQLQTEYLAGHVEKPTIRATVLTEEQDAICFKAVVKLGDDWPRLMDAVDYWIDHGRPAANRACPRLDEAVEKFLEHVDKSKRRFETKRGLKTRLQLFASAMGNCRADAITSTTINKFLNDRDVSERTKVNDRSAVSTFFRFCAHHDRKWVRENPVRNSDVPEPEDKPIQVVPIDICAALLKEAQCFKSGKMLPYFVLALIAGIRPYELQRLDFNAVNVTDGEITIEANVAKTKKKRVVLFHGGPPSQKPFNAMLRAWLKICKRTPIFPSNADKDIERIKRNVGVPKVDDVLRHTAISNLFRLTNSFGLCAEMCGNSEKKIKDHYLGKVSTAEMKRFYAIRPKGKATR